MRFNKTMIALAVVAVLVVIGLLLYSSGSVGSFRLVHSTPKLGGKIPTSTGTIKLDFNKTLVADYQVTEGLGGPDISVVSGIDVEDKSLLIRLQTLETDRTYKFNLGGVRSTNGEVIKNIEIKFSAEYVPFSQLSGSQKQLEISQTDRGGSDDPLTVYLPYQGEQIYLSGEHAASEDGDPIFVVNAQLFLRNADLDHRSASIARLKKEVANYIKSKNLDPQKYLIRYVINEAPAR